VNLKHEKPALSLVLEYFLCKPFVFNILRKQGVITLSEVTENRDFMVECKEKLSVCTYPKPAELG
jgi:hypothetical protein